MTSGLRGGEGLGKTDPQNTKKTNGRGSKTRGGAEQQMLNKIRALNVGPEPLEAVGK